MSDRFRQSVPSSLGLLDPIIAAEIIIVDFFLYPNLIIIPQNFLFFQVEGPSN